MSANTQHQFPVLAELVAGSSFDRMAMKLLLVVAGSAALTLSAKTNVPFFPVPMTLQTLVVLLLGAAYGPRLAAATVLVYLAQGAAGLPVLAGTPERGIGLAYMVGPTGGFLAGFIIAAALTGALARFGWTASVGRATVTMTAGTVALYVPGLLWLGFFADWDKALELGLMPFVYGDMLKLAVAAIAAPVTWHILHRIR
ncbi:biotin transport system substrate-specific component [Mesorhizobium sp. J18]|uniref:biotin transporter BioY n=1 Tax=Mesorhizobium sp. J18 TaxID=935263 RepID=UPI00119A2DD7|nr:biotin transporter BioY [Mesorhizobium sp. J18]TWH01179.1 biotin transport system substrate-specific component [Mesorhizobium sp. J18]